MVNPKHTRAEKVLEELTQTLLYEGYALYPYRSSALKNKKPIPFGVVFPEAFCIHNQHANAQMQTQCIFIKKESGTVEISIKFLHLVRVALFQMATNEQTTAGEFLPADHFSAAKHSFNTGWQAVEREVNCGCFSVDVLTQQKQAVPISFNATNHSENNYNENGSPVAMQIFEQLAIKGFVSVDAQPIENKLNAFLLTVHIVNTSEVKAPEKVSRDEALQQAFVSTHTILKGEQGEFISDQNPGAEWASIKRENKNTWPVLLEETNTIMLSSPIILYDYPRINAGSKGNLFDSTEIEEALWLHVNVLTDEEKRQAKLDDEKTGTIINRAGSITPEEMIRLHDQLKQSEQKQTEP